METSDEEYSSLRSDGVSSHIPVSTSHQKYLIVCVLTLFEGPLETVGLPLQSQPGPLQGWTLGGGPGGGPWGGARGAHWPPGAAAGRRSAAPPRYSRALRDRALRDRELRDRALQDRELRDRELRDRELRDRELRDRELRDRELQDRVLRDRELRAEEALSSSLGNSLEKGSEGSSRSTAQPVAFGPFTGVSRKSLKPSAGPKLCPQASTRPSLPIHRGAWGSSPPLHGSQR
ncbi:unnamed protein product [Gadus morhua 'NCC']